MYLFIYAIYNIYNVCRLISIYIYIYISMYEIVTIKLSYIAIAKKNVLNNGYNTPNLRS